MPLPVPNLDDRSYDQLVSDALVAVSRLCPGWTDLSPSDPGRTLLEVFAYLTDALLYRLNRLPEKAYVAFLNLVGIRQQPPAAAGAQLVFTLREPASAAVVIPRGTRVTLRGAGRDAPVFSTVDDATIEAGSQSVTTPAFHAELVEHEPVGTSSGQPGQQMRLARPPVVMESRPYLPLRLFVEATAEELAGRPAAAEIDGRPYREWREVDTFVDLGDDRAAYVVDRLDGVVTFAPAVRQLEAPGDDGRPRLGDIAALADVPAQGRGVRVSYWRGGGAAGNVGAGMLEELVDPVPGADLSVTNPQPATGGQDGETVENAMRRGPQELHRFGRAVTARDYDLVATEATGAVGRSRTFAKATLWRHARPGTIQTLLVPNLASADAILGADAAAYESRQTPEAQARVAEELARRSVLGTSVDVAWARYKPVSVEAKVVVHRGENPAVVEPRLQRALRSLISPLPPPVPPTATGRPGAAPDTAMVSAGWPFGQPLRASDLYDVLLRDQSVRFVERLVVKIDQAPTQVRTISADPHQDRTWYCGSGGVLFRSMDDGDGWDPVATFEGATVEVVRTHPSVPGLVVIACGVPGTPAQSQVWASRDCGESWARLREVDHVNDLAILHQAEGDVAFLAADTGLLRLPVPTDLSSLEPDAVTADGVQLRDDIAAGHGAYAVEVVEFESGDVSVVVALTGRDGVLLSHRGGRPGTFNPPVQVGTDIRHMCTRSVGPRRFLYAGVTAQENDPGFGAIGLELLQAQQTPPSPTWTELNTGWVGGGCEDIAVAGDFLVAASHRNAVMRLDLNAATPVWTASSIDCGLPPRSPDGPFQPVDEVAVSAVGVVLAAAAGQLFRLPDVDARVDRWDLVSSSEFTDRVTLSPTWLFTSGTHRLDLEVSP